MPVEPLRQRAAKLMARANRLDELRDLARDGDPQAAKYLMRQLARNGRVDELRELTANGERAARWALADWLLTKRRVTDAVEVMRPLAAAGVPGAQRRLARLLGGLGRHVEAMAELADAPPHHDDLTRVKGWLDARNLTDRSGRPFQGYVTSRPSPRELAWVVLLLWDDHPRTALDLLPLIGPDKWLHQRLRTQVGDLLALHREGPHLTGVAFSPDSKTLAISEGSTGTIRLRDVATGEAGLVLRTDGTWTCGVAWSPDGTTLACAGERVRLWDARTGAVLRDLAGGTSWAVAFSPDSTLVAGDGLWRVDTGERLADLPTPLAVAFSPDGRRLAVAAETPAHHSRLQVLEVPTGHVLTDLPSQHALDAVGTVAFSPDGTLAATGTRGRSLHLWNLTTGAPERVLWIGSLTPVAFHPAGTLFATRDTTSDDTAGATSADGRRVRLWEVASGAQVRTIDTAADHLTFSPDGTLLATVDAATATVALWRL